MPQKVNKDGLATVFIGDYEVKRRVFAGDQVPDDWKLEQSKKAAEKKPDPEPEPVKATLKKKADADPGTDA